MAENDGNTVPAVQPSGVHRPLKTTPSELLPLEPAVFEAIHRLNSRFERILHDFRGLQTFPYFPHDKLTAWQMSLASSRPKPILLSRQPFTNEPKPMHSILIDSVLVGNANWPTRMTFSWKLNTESRNWLTKKNRGSQPFNECEFNRVFCNAEYPLSILLPNTPQASIKINSKYDWPMSLSNGFKRVAREARRARRERPSKIFLSTEQGKARAPGSRRPWVMGRIGPANRQPSWEKGCGTSCGMRLSGREPLSGVRKVCR